MYVCVALLRGINVGGHNRIKMSDLREMLEGMGFGAVQTYIQSGNVVFKAQSENQTMERDIEQRIEDIFGLSVPVVVRSAEELRGLVDGLPFSESLLSDVADGADGETLYVALLRDEPTEEQVAAWRAHQTGGEDYVIAGKHVYLLFREGIRSSKLASNLQKLDSAATVRNWKTMCKLKDLATAMDGE